MKICDLKKMVHKKNKAWFSESKWFSAESPTWSNKIWFFWNSRVIFTFHSMHFPISNVCMLPKVVRIMRFCLYGASKTKNERHPVITGGVAELLNEALGGRCSTTIFHECLELIPHAQHFTCTSACGSGAGTPRGPLWRTRMKINFKSTLQYPCPLGRQ